MNGIIDNIIDGIYGAIKCLKNIFKRIINGVLNFINHVVDWFKNLPLNQQKHTPFIANQAKIKEMLKTAPVKYVGLFKGVYNEQTDEIEYNELIEADSFDQQTKQVLGDEELVVLS